MSNDDSRDNEGPDRRNASTPNAPIDDPTQPIRTYLEALDTLTRSLHARLHLAEIDGEPVPEETRREARRRCREIRAETSQIGLSLIGPEAAIPYNPDEADDAGRGVTTFSGPSPGKIDRERRRTRDPERTPEGNQESDCRNEDDTDGDDTDGGEHDD